MRPVSSHPVTYRDLGWTAVIFASALGLRLAWAWQYAAHPLGRLAWVDELAYLSRARAIHAGAWLPDQPFYQDPLIAYVLAALMPLVGTEVGSLRLAMAVLGSLTPPLLFWAGRLGLGRAEGVVAGLAAAAYGPLAFADGLLEKEGPAALVAALALLLTARAADGVGRGRGRSVFAAAASGLAWGALALLRANALVVAPLGVAWWVACDGLRRPARAAAFGLGCAAALAPVTLVNAALSRHPELILTTWQGGANFYIGNGPEANGTYATLGFVVGSPAREAGDFAAEAERRAGRPLSPAGVSHFWYAEGLRRWRDAPAASARLLARKLGLVLHDYDIPDSQDAAAVRLAAAPLLGLAFLGFGLVAPWAALGLGREPRTPYWCFLVVTTAAGLVTTAAFFVVGRYRVPWAPGLLLLAGAGVTDSARRVASRRWGSLVCRVSLLAAPAAALAWLPTAFAVPVQWVHTEIYLAVAYTESGDFDEALDALDDARAMGPSAAALVEYALRGRLHDRIAGIVSRLSPDTPALVRARLLRQFPEGRAEARRLIDMALAADPADPLAWRESGAWRLDRDTDPAARRTAIDELTRAAQGDRGDPSAAVMLALLRGDVGPLSGTAARTSGPDSPRLAVARAAIGSRARGGKPGTN